MAQLELAAAVEDAQGLVPFSLRIPLLSEGSKHILVAESDGLWVMIKSYASGGENALHAHPKEDHLFVVLKGEATFYGKDFTPIKVPKHRGMLIPKGVLYCFQSSGDEELVLLRVGEGRPSKDHNRQGADGRPLEGDSADNKDGAKPGVPIPGRFFAD